MSRSPALEPSSEGGAVRSTGTPLGTESFVPPASFFAVWDASCGLLSVKHDAAKPHPSSQNAKFRSIGLGRQDPEV